MLSAYQRRRRNRVWMMELNALGLVMSILVSAILLLELCKP